ncbi:hypothetical protein APY03_0781 [Variovorax sp. WDL1]|nr:hypothetical protein APY03_0781 [Variovorax sp. WDL1]
MAVLGAHVVEGLSDARLITRAYRRRGSMLEAPEVSCPHFRA